MVVNIEAAPKSWDGSHGCKLDKIDVCMFTSFIDDNISIFLYNFKTVGRELSPAVYDEFEIALNQIIEKFYARIEHAIDAARIQRGIAANEI